LDKDFDAALRAMARLVEKWLSCFCLRDGKYSKHKVMFLIAEKRIGLAIATF
jgi:hypothetical protein